MKTVKTVLIGAVAFFGLLGCRSASNPDSDVNALVTPAQFARAMAAIQDMRSYIPFQEQGTCDARATWMAAILAAEGIPSSRYYLFAPNGEKLRGPNEVLWDYHVGIMIRANDSSEAMVLDPTFADSWMNSERKWRQQMTPRDDAPTALVPGSLSGKDVVNNPGGNQNWWVNSFAEMPKFQLADVEKACGTMKQFQNLIPRFDSNNAPARLKSEMLRLTKALEDAGKLEWGSLGRDAVYCGRERLK